MDLSITYVNISEELNAIKESDPSKEMFSPIIKSDGSRIQQVLLNLQSNAIKFTSKGSIKIIVEITRRIFDPNEIEMEN